MKQCVIMGNGPSLNEIPVSVLDQIPSFGVNYTPHQPTYFVCVDQTILLDHWKEIYDHAKNAKMAFLSAKMRGSSELYDLTNVRLISIDTNAFKEEKYFSGMTVVYVCLKVAYYLGFEEVHLWGVDHSADWRHYRDDYPPGDTDRRQWRMDWMEYHYRLAQKVYNQAGRRIVNYSHPSALDEIFERDNGGAIE